jgi:hypothetical protein
MDSPCAECQAINSELVKASHAVRDHMRHEGASPVDLAAWLEQLNEEECADMRETSSLWATWRRLRGHRALTGHSLLALPLPPQAILNSN